MSRIRDVAVGALWLLPSGATKRTLLRRFGHDIDASAVAEPNVVWRVGRVRLAAGARLARFNIVKDLRSLELGEGARVGRMNRISTHPVYRTLLPSGARLVIGPHGGVTSRHTLDCSGGIHVGELALVAGQGSLLLSHALDLRRDAQTAAPIAIGARTFVSARCLVLGGARVPELSVVAAGAVVTRAREELRPGLYAGVPATRRSDVDGAWFERSQASTRRVYVPETGETVEDAF